MGVAVIEDGIRDEGAGAVRAILIAGPTASGKSALAAAVAERVGGAVVNADSMQVYADLPILSAQPDAAERARAPHHLFGHVDGAEAYSVGRWLGDVAPMLAALRAEGRMPVLVGGTGLYFKALTEGLSAMPDVPDDLRAALRAEASTMSAAALHARLGTLDPLAAARLRPSDPQRILRALEIVMATGRSITLFQGMREPPTVPMTAVQAVFLMPERTTLRARIDARFEAMVARGAVHEVERLRARGLDPALPAMRALGVPSLLAYLEGRTTRTEAVATGQAQSWAYARRQVTFGRHQLTGFVMMHPDEAAAALLP